MARHVDQRLADLRIAAEALGAIDQPGVELVFGSAHAGDQYASPKPIAQYLTSAEQRA